MPRVLVAYADGSEDMEVTAVASILARGGVDVLRCAVRQDGSRVVTLSHGTKVTCDANIKDVAGEVFDMIAIPGGLKGSENCANCAELVSMLKAQKEAGRHIAAICAAPGFTLERHGLIGDARATGYPGCSDNIRNYTGEGATVDPEHHLVTGKGPAFAVDFALACLSVLVDAAKLESVKSGMLYEDRS